MNLQLGGGTARIWFAGDIHGRFSHILAQLERTPPAGRPAAIIFLGDLEPQQPLRQEFQPLLDAGAEPWFIHGNHDTDRAEIWENVVDVQARNLHGRVVTIAGLRIAGLGGIFRGQVWYPRTGHENPLFDSYSDLERDLRRRPGVRRRVSRISHVLEQAVPSREGGLTSVATLSDQLLKHFSTIFPATVRELAQQKAEILVTHEAPAAHPFGFAAIDALANAMGVQAVFHGHHHNEKTYPETAQWGYRIIHVGLRGIRDLQGRVIRPAEPG